MMGGSGLGNFFYIICSNFFLQNFVPL